MGSNAQISSNNEIKSDSKQPLDNILSLLNFSVLLGLFQGPKMAKICKISYKQAAQGSVPPRKIAKTSLSCDTDVG